MVTRKPVNRQTDMWTLSLPRIWGPTSDWGRKEEAVGRTTRVWWGPFSAGPSLRAPAKGRASRTWGLEKRAPAHHRCAPRSPRQASRRRPLEAS